MIPTAQAAHDAGRLLDELGSRLNRDEQDALREVIRCAGKRFPVGQDVADLVGRAMRKRDAAAWLQ